MPDELPPPVAKYRLELIVSGNSHAEIAEELYAFAHGGYLIDSDYEKRDDFQVAGGRHWASLKHTNPEMTPERYVTELHEWAVANRFIRNTNRADGSQP